MKHNKMCHTIKNKMIVWIVMMIVSFIATNGLFILMMKQNNDIITFNSLLGMLTIASMIIFILSAILFGISMYLKWK